MDKCFECGSEELDFLVDHDVECRDCGYTVEWKKYHSIVESARLGLPIVVTDEELPVEVEV